MKGLDHGRVDGVVEEKNNVKEKMCILSRHSLYLDEL